MRSAFGAPHESFSRRESPWRERLSPVTRVATRDEVLLGCQHFWPGAGKCTSGTRVGGHPRGEGDGTDVLPSWIASFTFFGMSITGCFLKQTVGFGACCLCCLLKKRPAENGG